MKKLLISLRKKNNLTQVEMCSLLKVSQGMWSRMENGRVEIPLMIAVKIRRRFQLSKKQEAEVNNFIESRI